MFVGNGQTQLETTSVFPKTWACSCLPSMPESVWQGCVCLHSGTAPVSLEKPAVGSFWTPARCWTCPFLFAVVRFNISGPSALKTLPKFFQAVFQNILDTDGLRMRLSEHWRHLRNGFEVDDMTTGWQISMGESVSPSSL